MLERLTQKKLKRSGNSIASLRRHNRRVVLHALRSHGSLSKAELARATGLTPQAIANIVEDLIASGLVRQAGRRRSPRGQPPIEIEIAKDGGYAVGIRIDATHYHTVVADLGGDILEMREGMVPPGGSKDWLKIIASILADANSTLAKDRCLGLGLVTPGPFDTNWPGVPSPGAIPALQSRNVADDVAASIGVDVFLENDATSAALGERLYGEARGIDNFFYVFIGEGVGGGIVINGEPYRGTLGNAGEFGHIIIDPKGPQCYCGNRGCLGEYLSLGAKRSWLVGRNGADTREQPLETAWIRQAADALSIGLASIENLFDPEVIIIGGAAPAPMLRSIVDQLGELRPSVRQNSSKDRLRLSTLGERSAAMGASALPILAATSA